MAEDQNEQGDNNPIYKEGIDEQWLMTLADSAIAELKDGNFDKAMRCLEQSPQLLSWSHNEDSTKIIQMFKHAGLTREQLEAVLNDPDLKKKLLHDRDPEEFKTKALEDFDNLSPVSVEDALAEVAPVAEPQPDEPKVETTTEDAEAEVAPVAEPQPNEPKVETTEETEPKVETTEETEPKVAEEVVPEEEVPTEDFDTTTPFEGMELTGGNGPGTVSPRPAGVAPELFPLQDEIFTDLRDWFMANTRRSGFSMLQEDMANNTKFNPFHSKAIDNEKFDLSAILNDEASHKSLVEEIAKQLGVAVDNIFVGNADSGNPDSKHTTIGVNAFAFEKNGAFNHRLTSPIKLDLKTILAGDDPAFDADAELVDKLEPLEIAEQHVYNVKYNQFVLANAIPYALGDSFNDPGSISNRLASLNVYNVEYLRKGEDTDNPYNAVQWQFGSVDQAGKFSAEGSVLFEPEKATVSNTHDIAVLSLIEYASGKSGTWESFALDENGKASNADFVKTCAGFGAAGLPLDKKTTDRLTTLLQDPNFDQQYRSEHQKFSDILKPEQPPAPKKTRVNTNSGEQPGGQ